MAVATSPYQRNDYQAANTFRPHQLPVNDIMKAYIAQNQFWDISAARIKNVYEDALNLKLTLEPNKEIRDNFMKDAEKQLNDLSSMDVSDPSVQRKGISLFRPLFKDEGIMYDDAMTRHYEKVRTDAMRFRDEDNGKAYSDINLGYAMDGYAEFINSTDRFAGKKLYGSRKEYTPYFDYTSEYEKALRSCKPSSNTQKSPLYSDKGDPTDYSLITSSKFLSAEQARICIESGVSSNALRQLQIEGVMNYKGNKAALGSDTATYLNSVTGNLSEQLAQFSAQKQAINDSKDLKPEQKEAAIKQLDLQMEKLTSEVTDNNVIIGKLQSGDFSPIDENYDAYAGSVYTFKKLYRKAVASAFQENEKREEADPVQMANRKFARELYLDQLNFDQTKALKDIDFQYDQQLKWMDLMYGGKNSDGSSKGKTSPIYKNPMTGQWEIDPNLQWKTPIITDKPNEEKGVYEHINNQLTEINTKSTSDNLELYNTLVERGNDDITFRESILKAFPQYENSDKGWNDFKTLTANNKVFIDKQNKVGGIEESTWFQTYFELNKDDKTLNNWAERYSENQAAIGALKMKLDIGEREVTQRLGGDYRTILNKSLDNIKPVLVGNDEVTARDIQSAIEGTSGRLRIVNTPSTVTSSSSAGIPVSSASVVREYYLDGKKLPADKINPLYRKVISTGADVTGDVDKARGEVYNRLGFNRERWALVEDEDNPIVTLIRNNTNFGIGTDDENVDKRIYIKGTDFSGGIEVNIPGLKRGSEDQLAALRALSIGTPNKIEITENGTAVFRDTNYNLLPLATNSNPALKDAAYQISNIASSTAYQSAQPGQKIPDSDIEVPVYISGKRQAMVIKTYKTSTGNPEYRVYVKGATDPSPKATATNPYDLFEKLSALRFEFKKPLQ